MSALGNVLTAGGSSLLGTAINTGAQYLLNQQTFKQQQQLIQQQNDYNSTARQVQRLKEAGLNPALAYGQATTGNQTTPGEALHTDVTPGNLGALDAIALHHTIANQDANTDSVLAQTDQTRQNMYWQNIQEALDATGKGIANKTSQVNLDNLQNIIDHNLSAIETDNALKATQGQKNLQDIEESKSNVKLNASQIAVNNNRINEILSNINLNKAQRQLILQDVKNAQQQFILLQRQITGKDLEIEEQKMKNEFRRKLLARGLSPETANSITGQLTGAGNFLRKKLFDEK